MAARMLTKGLGGAMLCWAAAAFAITGNQQVELAGSGRFDELAKQLEVDAAAGGNFAVADRHALCYAYSKLKHYGKLFDCLSALEQQARGPNRRTRLFGLDDVTPTIGLMRSEALIDLGRYPEAVAAAKQVLEWYAKEQSEDKDIEANALAALTLAHAFNGERTAAEEAATRLEKVDASWPRYNAYANAKAAALARANLALGRYEKTLQAIAENKSFGVQVFLDNLLSGAALRGTSNWIWAELPRGYMMAKAAKELGRRDEAKAGYDRLLAVKAVEANGEIYWLILADRGRIAEDEGQEDEAIALYARAIDVLEAQRSSINTEANKIGFIGNKQEVYERIIQLLLKRGQSGQALEYVERSKSRALIDMLAARLVSPDFVKPSREAGLALTAYLGAETQAKIQAPTSADTPSEKRTAVIRAAERLRQAAPEIASLISVEKRGLADLQKWLGADETMVQYYVGGSRSHVFVVTKSGVKTHTVITDGLSDAVKQLRVAMEKRDARVPELSKALYDRLFGPFAAEIKTRNLLIVPHGPLHYLSFAGLYDGNQYLVDRYALRSLPSASVLEYIRPRRTATRESVLVLGNPDLGDRRYDLPNAQVEAELVARNTPHSQLFVRKAASESVFVDQAGKYSMLHVASHGEFNGDTPLNSALMLVKDSRNDGALTVAELYALKLDADLVTLSACETGLGKVSSGDDVVGLSRGFLFAGARSIVASLWNVDDKATSFLMERFYAQLKSGNKRDALRQAQLETKKRFPHPFYWAPFYLIGSEK
jgi:CHAT domain-containing protein